MLLSIEENNTLCIYDRKKTLPFGEAHWDYLPDLVQNYIEDLAARSLLRDRMKHVCQSIKLYKQWCVQQSWLTELFFYSYEEISRFSSSFIESQVCNKCFKKFSPEIVLSKHLSICRGPDFEDLEEEIEYYRSFFEDEEYDNNNNAYYGDF